MNFLNDTTIVEELILHKNNSLDSMKDFIVSLIVVAAAADRVGLTRTAEHLERAYQVALSEWDALDNPNETDKIVHLYKFSS